METRSFVRDKLTEWNLSQFIQRFEDEGIIDKERFLSLVNSDSLNVLIPKIGPRVKFRQRLREDIQGLNPSHTDNEEMMDTDTPSDQEDCGEMDSTFFSWLGQSSTTGSDRGSDAVTSHASDDPVYPGATVTQRQGILAAILFILRHRLKETTKCDLMALIHFLIPNLFDESKSLFDKIPGMSIEFYCKTCQNYMGRNPSDACCVECGTMFNRADSFKNMSFFMFTSLKDLLKDILKYHGTKLLLKTINHGQDIKDVMDGRIYQNLLKQKILATDDLTLSWNCDGLHIYPDKNFYSVWSLQFSINELPYALRKENVAVAGVWFGSKHPEMKTFLKPFIDECCDLAQNPFDWMDSDGSVHSSKVFAVICSSDAEARPLLRNCKKFNGEYGCDWCLHPGTIVEKGAGSMRSYTYDNEKQRARSDEMFRDDAEAADVTGEPKNGVKGQSLLSKIPEFDIVFGFVPEYMHSVLLGVTRQLMFLWLDPSNSTKPWFVGEQISEMDHRLLGLKPPVEMTECPRSLKCRDSWKASEWRAFLLFYAIQVLPRFLSRKFLEHFFLLSFSIHILLQESISHDDLQLARDYLVHFVINMKELYGEENVSFNCHQLIHLSESVLNWGPLWATSAFSFERNNGALRALLGTIDYNVKHVTEKFLTWQHIPRHLSSLVFNHGSDFSTLLTKMSPGNDGSGSFKPLGEACLLDLNESIKPMLGKLLNQPVFAKSAETYDKFTHDQTVYHSTNFEKSDKTECVIELRNGSYGEIHTFLLLKVNCMCTSSCVCQAIPVIVVKLYVTKPVELFGETVPYRPTKAVFVTTESTGQLKAFFLENIRRKCMCVNGLLVPVPNTHEKY